MCREEKIKHKKRMRKLENLYRHNLRRMRKTLEVKLEKSATVLEEQREERKKKITECVSSNSKCVISNPSLPQELLPDASEERAGAESEAGAGGGAGAVAAAGGQHRHHHQSNTLYVTQKIIINMQLSRQGSHYSPWSIKPAIMYPLLVCLVASSKYFYRII